MTFRSPNWLWMILLIPSLAVGQDAPASLPDALPAIPVDSVLESTSHGDDANGSDPPIPTEAPSIDDISTQVVPTETPNTGEIVPGEITPEASEEIIVDDSNQMHMEGEGEPGDAWDSCTIGDFTFDFPRWYFRTEMMWLDRTTQGDLATATTRDANGNLGNFRVDSASFQTTPGTRMIVGRNFNDGMTYFELAYTGLFDWNSGRILGIGTDLDIVDPNLDVGLVALGFTGQQEVNRQFVDYKSILNDGELNVRSFMSPGFAVIFGARYAAINEELVIVERGTTAFNQAILLPYKATRDTSVENGLLLAQMGGDFYCDLTDDVRLNLLGKIGLGGNFSKSTLRQAVQVNAPNNSGPISSASRVQVDEEVVIAGVLDTAAGIDIQLTRNIVFRGGYHFMWFNGVAVAPEQVPNLITDQNGPQRQIENGANIFLYGPYVGLQISWGGLD